MYFILTGARTQERDEEKKSIQSETSQGSWLRLQKVNFSNHQTKSLLTQNVFDQMSYLS